MRLRWTDVAVQDLTSICDYIQQNSAAAARRVATSIHEQIGFLAQFPESGRTGRKPETRELVLSRLPYLVIYRLHGDAIEILRILHGAQNWPE